MTGGSDLGVLPETEFHGTYTHKRLGSWGDRSVGKVLAMRTLGPEKARGGTHL